MPRIDSSGLARQIIREKLVSYLLDPQNASTESTAALQNSFRPFATIECERTEPDRPTQAIIRGAPALLHIDLDETQPGETFIYQALVALEQRLADLGMEEMPFYGRPRSVLVTYEPGYAVRFNLLGKVIGANC